MLSFPLICVKGATISIMTEKMDFTGFDENCIQRSRVNFTSQQLQKSLMGILIVTITLSLTKIMKSIFRYVSRLNTFCVFFPCDIF